MKKRVKSLPSCPPEVWEAVLLEGYNIQVGSDVWQLAMMIFVCLTTRFPWDKADITDPRFTEFVDWQKRKTTRTPKEFRGFSPRLLRLLRRLMELKPTKRYPVTETNKYLRDRWLVQRSPRASSAHPQVSPPPDQASAPMKINRFGPFRAMSTEVMSRGAFRVVIYCIRSRGATIGSERAKTIKICVQIET